MRGLYRQEQSSTGRSRAAQAQAEQSSSSTGRSRAAIAQAGADAEHRHRQEQSSNSRCIHSISWFLRPQPVMVASCFIRLVCPRVLAWSLGPSPEKQAHGCLCCDVSLAWCQRSCPCGGSEPEAHRNCHLKACPLPLSPSQGPCQAKNDLEPLRQPLPAALLLLIQHWAISSGTGCA